MLILFQKTGPLIYPLVLFSFLAFILILERILYFFLLPSTSRQAQFKQLNALLKRNQHLSKSMRDELVSYALCEVRERVEFGIHALRMIAVLSPMIGLLGTITGMIEAFRAISDQTGPVSPSIIAQGLWQAMLTTAFGLSIALPVLIFVFILSRIASNRLCFFQNALNFESLSMEGANLKQGIIQDSKE